MVYHASPCFTKVFHVLPWLTSNQMARFLRISRHLGHPAVGLTSAATRCFWPRDEHPQKRSIPGWCENIIFTPEIDVQYWKLPISGVTSCSNKAQYTVWWNIPHSYPIQKSHSSLSKTPCQVPPPWYLPIPRNWADPTTCCTGAFSLSASPRCSSTVQQVISWDPKGPKGYRMGIPQ
jgi:hypothetical protein